MMGFAIIYLLVATAAIVVLPFVLRRRPEHVRPGMDYLRAALICSSALLLGQVLAFLVFGVWFIPPAATIGIGFVIPGGMRLIT